MIYYSQPIRIRDDALDAFPDAFRPALQIILDGARRKFQGQWNFQEAVDYLLIHMQAFFSGAVKSAEDAGSTLRLVGEFMDRLADLNPARDWAATDELKQAARNSPAWRDFTRAIEGAANKNQQQNQRGSNDV